MRRYMWKHLARGQAHSRCPRSICWTRISILLDGHPTLASSLKSCREEFAPCLLWHISCHCILGTGVVTWGLDLCPLGKWVGIGRSSSLQHLNKQMQNPDLGAGNLALFFDDFKVGYRATLTETLNFFGLNSATDKARGKYVKDSFQFWNARVPVPAHALWGEAFLQD